MEPESVATDSILETPVQDLDNLTTPQQQSTGSSAKALLVGFISYLLIGAAIHLVYRLFFTDVMGTWGLFLNAPYVTLLSTYGALYIAGSGGSFVTSMIVFEGILLLQIFVTSYVPYRILSNKFPETKVKRLVILFIVLAVFPYIAKLIYSPIQIFLDGKSNEQATQNTLESQIKYQDIPIKILSDSVVTVEPYGLGSRQAKRLEVTLEVDMPVSAQSPLLDCHMYESVDADTYRHVTNDVYFVGQNTATLEEPISSLLSLPAGKNLLRYHYYFQDVQSLEGKPSEYEAQKAGQNYLLRNGPYTIYCRMMSFKVDGKFFQTKTSGPTIIAEQIRDREGISNYYTFKSIIGSNTNSYSDAYTNTGLYVTKAYTLGDFLK